MPSRRNVLEVGGAVAATTLAGCLGEVPAIDGGSDPRLTATRVNPLAVPSGAVVAPATDGLLATVRTAATTDGRVDHTVDGPVDWEAGLVLAVFEIVRFRGETYDPTSGFVYFAEEASYSYSAERVAESEVKTGLGVVDYGNLSADERTVTDRLLAGEEYSVGMHEEKPASLAVFDEHLYVRTDEGTYVVGGSHGDSGPHHVLRLDPVEPGPDATVVTVADRAVPAGVEDVVLSAVEEEESVALDGDERDALASFLDGVGYVATVDAVTEVELHEAGW